MPKPLKLIFMGTPEFAVPALQALIDAGHDIRAVYSQPPRPAGRGKKLRKSPVHELADKHGIEVRTPTSLKSRDAQIEFDKLKADAAVVAAYGLILPKAILEAPKLGCLNIHPSLLPRWRGAAPIPHTILAGDEETAVCIMQMDEGLDTGDILAQENTPVKPEETAGTLHDRLAKLGAELLVKTLDEMTEGKIHHTPQTGEGAIYAPKISKKEGHIHWNSPAEELERLVRGMSPWPGAFFTYEGENIKVLSVALAEGEGEPGEVLDDMLTVACGKGALRLTRLQRPGRKPMGTADFLRGFPFPKGTVL